MFSFGCNSGKMSGLLNPLSRVERREIPGN
jgi:hypothetical protein